MPFSVLKCLLVPIHWNIVIQPTSQKPSAHACPSRPQRTSRYHPKAPAVPPQTNSRERPRAGGSGVPDLSADRCGAGVGRFGGRKGVGKMAASVRGLLQLPSMGRLLGFRVWLSVKRPAPRARVFAPGSPSGVACPPAAISPGYCCPDLFVIDRSCGCLCDYGIAGRFLGSDAAVGDGLALLAGGGLAVC